MPVAVTLTLIVVVAVLLSGCRQSRRPGVSGQPVRVLLYPSNRGDAHASARRDLSERLAAATGLGIELEVPIDYFTAVQVLGNGEVDIAFLNNLSYLLAEEFYGAKALLTVLRHGGLSHHRGQLLVRRGVGLEKLADVAGKRIAFVDPYSVTGFVLPAHLLTQRGVAVGASTFVGSHGEVVRQVYTGAVDVGATYDDGETEEGPPADVRVHLASRFPDMAERLMPIAWTQSIPNEPVAVRRGVDAAVVKRVIAGLRTLPNDPVARAALLKLGDIEGFKVARDRDYTPLRGVLREMGKEVEEMIPGGWRLRLRTSDEVR